MQFVIQVGDPIIFVPQTKEIPNLALAIEELFPMQTEEIILYWYWVPVRIGYKYDLSVLIDELLPLLWALLHTEQGKYKVAWDSTSFSAYWFLVWDEQQMTIEAEWHAVAGQYETFINSHPKVKTTRLAFLQEWKGVLKRLLQAIVLAEIQIEAQEELKTLCLIEAAIPAFGQLYQSSVESDAPTTDESND